MFIARNTVAFVVAYLVLMVPTYILPYFGSNSTLVNGLSAGLGMGPTPQWWAHVWCLSMLMVLAWLRGSAVAKGFLPIFPVLAAVFDMTPGLSVIPLIPTFLHVGGMILGTMGVATTATEASAGNVELALGRKARIVVALSTILAVGGSALFASTVTKGAKNLQGASSPAQVNAPANPVLTTPESAPVQALVQSAPSPVVEAPILAPQVAVAAVAAHKPEPRAKVHKHHQAAAKTHQAGEKPTVRYINLND